MITHIDAWTESCRRQPQSSRPSVQIEQTPRPCPKCGQVHPQEPAYPHEEWEPPILGI